MNYRGFRIENEPAYIWRTYCNPRNERDDNAQAWFEHGYQQSQR